MKKLHTFLPMMVVACLLMLLPTLKAEAAEGKPGQEITVTFSFNEIRGLDGVFTFSNEGILENISYSSTFSGVRFNENKVFYSTTNQGATQGSITVTATIKANAAVGSSCTVTLGDINITDTDTNSVYSGSKSEVVNVVAEPVVTKAPVNPTPTPASSSATAAPTTGNSNQNQNSGNQGQNVVDNSSGNQSQNSTPTDTPAQNNVNNNKNTSSTTKNTEVPAASGSPDATATATEEPVTSDGEADEWVEVNTDAYQDKNTDSGKKNGSNIWLILFLISLIINLLVIGFLLWRKYKKNSEDVLIKDDTPIVDYDIDEDFDDDMI